MEHQIPLVNNIEPVKNPDLIIEIKSTPKQLENFGIKVEGSKIIRRGKPGKIENDTGTFAIPTETFDLSQDNFQVLDQPARKEGELRNRNTVLTWAVQNHPDLNLHKFPNATHVSLSYHTPETKPRTHVPAEYMGDYFELVITNKDGSKEIYHLEQNFEIHKKQ
jgi:hypothetical protein